MAGNGHRVGRPANEGRSAGRIRLDRIGQAGDVRGEVVFQRQEAAAVGIVGVLTNGPGGAGGGDEGQAAHRPVDGGAVLFSKVADGEDGQVPFARQGGQGNKQIFD